MYDITPDIADALKDYIDFKHSGVSDIDAFLAQQDMFANRPSLTESIMREFFAKKASQQQIADTLREYAKLAMLQDNDTPALFETEVAPRERLWELAVNKATGERYSIEAGVSSTPSAEEVAEARRQYDEVVARYTNPDGTKKPGWMKAPNGNPTKLTEEQWVWVRTPNFKKWFGDWEALVELVLPKATSTNDARSALEKLAGRKITNIVTGMTAVVNRNQREKILSREACRKSEANGFSMEEHNAAASIVDKLWKHAELLISHDDRNDDANIKQVHRFVAPISSNKGIVFAYITVKESTDHGERVYSLELETLKTLEGHMGKLVEAHPTSSVSEGIITKLKDKVNPKNISKVVDENGEPLVVYRGDDDMASREYESGMFVSRDKDEASGYGEVYDLFVNARKIFDGSKDFDAIGDEVKENFETIKEELQSEVDEWQMEESYENWDDFVDAIKSNDWVAVERSNTLIDIIKSHGYDAIEIFEGASNLFLLNSPTQIKSATDNIGTYSQRSDIRWSIAPAEVSARLDAEPTIKVYRAMQIVDGKLYSPMAAKINGVWTDEQGMGKWLQADEHPELITPDGKFKLDKGNGTSVEAAYNPYWHTSNSPFNDQFSSAYLRPNLVVVEVEIPQSELSGKYWAKGAKDPVGPIANWHKGKTTAEIEKATGQKREVILSRWCKINRIVPVDEVADIVTGMVKDAGIVIDSNTITPALRSELTKRGVKINEVHPAAGEVKKAIANAIKNQTIANNISTKEQKVVVDAAMKFFNEFKAKRIPLSTGGEMFFAPSPEALERYGYDAVAAWAEYAIHQVTSDGGRKRTFAREKINQILPQIETIIAEDNVSITKRRGVERFIFQKLLDNKHIARIVATPVMNGLVVDLAEVTSVYMSKGNTTSMPLSRAIEEWKSSRGLYLTSSTTLSKPQPSDDVKQYSITAEVDRAYLDAVRRGDMETAQRMVREAFFRAFPDTQVLDRDGLPLVVYHGSEADLFNVFNNNKGNWFAEERNHSKLYGKTRPFFLNIKNPLDMGNISNSDSSESREVIEQRLGLLRGELHEKYFYFGEYLWQLSYDERFVDIAKKQGFDGIMAYEETLDTSSKVFNAFSPSQIKSADPVTYDDSVNVIPLSERFNSEKNDVRYSITMAPPPPNVSYILPTQNRADEIRVVSDEVAQKAMQGKNGLRPDGTRKGLGFFGALATSYGGVMTEFSVGFTYDGKNVDVPTLNPLLTRDEISYLLRGYIFEDDATWKNILDKTARWGAQRLKEGKSPFIEDGEPRIPIPQSNDIRFSIRVNDDLADLDKFNAFKSAMAIEQPMPEGVNLLPEGVSPFEALRYFEENILGKTIRMPDGETLTLDIGHFFRLVCDGSHGKKGYVEGFDSSKSALAAIRKNEVLPEKINGYQSDRARMLPVFLDTVEHPVIEMQEKNEPSKTQFVKRYDVDGGRGVVAAFRYIKDGKKIQSFHGFSTRYGKVKKYRITYVDDAAIRGASPDAPELTNQQAMYNVPQSAPTVNGRTARDVTLSILLSLMSRV